MSRVSSQVPASRATTLTPAWVSGRTATPPAAPRPMITTSVLLRSVAIAAAFPEHREVVGRAMVRRDPRAHLLFRGRDRRANARIADQIPADEVGVASVIRIAERPFDRVRTHQVEEDCGRPREAGCTPTLHVGEQRILLRRLQPRERRALRRS